MVKGVSLDSTKNPMDMYNRRRAELAGRQSTKYATEGYPPAIIEGIPFRRNGQRHSYSVLVLAPSDFVEKWPTVSSRFLNQLTSEVGPARNVTGTELVDLVEALSLEE